MPSVFAFVCPRCLSQILKDALLVQRGSGLFDSNSKFDDYQMTLKFNNAAIKVARLLPEFVNE